MIRALALCLIAGPALADPMTAQDFDAYVTGKTLTFAMPDGTPFGVEAYGPDRSVTWSSAPGLCQTGVWYDKAGLICFLYRNDPKEKCWTVDRTDRGLRAQSTEGTVLFEATEAQVPLVCPGPELLS